MYAISVKVYLGKVIVCKIDFICTLLLMALLFYHKKLQSVALSVQIILGLLYLKHVTLAKDFPNV